MHKEDIINLYTRYKLFLTPFIVVVSAIFIVYFIIYPQAEKIISLEDKISQMNKKKILLEEKIQKLQKLDEFDLKGKLNIVINTLPSDRDFANVLGLIQNLVSDYRLTLENFQTQSSEEKSAKVSSYSVNLGLKGPRSLVKGFIDSINSSFRLMRTNTISLTITPDENETSLGMTVNVFYSVIPASVGAVDSPLSELSSQDENLIQEIAGQQQLYVEVSSTPSGPRGKINPFE